MPSSRPLVLAGQTQQVMQQQEPPSWCPLSGLPPGGQSGTEKSGAQVEGRGLGAAAGTQDTGHMQVLVVNTYSPAPL